MADDDDAEEKFVRDREILLSGGVPKIDEESPLYSILSVLIRLEPPDFEVEDSVQFEVLKALHRDGRDVTAPWKAARESASRALVEVSSQVALGEKAKLTRHGAHEGAFRTAIIANPSRLLSDPQLVHWLVQNLYHRGSRFLSELADDFYNAERRNERVPVDRQLGYLAHRWLDPHMPLWLMKPTAVRNACKTLFQDEAWTEDSVKNRTKNRRLAGGFRHPIVSFEGKPERNGYYYRFGVSKKVFRLMEEKEFESRHLVRPGSGPEIPGEEAKKADEEFSTRIRDCAPEDWAQAVKDFGKKYPYRHEAYARYYVVECDDKWLRTS